MKKVVVFDMDGLLIDSEKIMLKFEAKGLRKVGIEKQEADKIAYEIVGLNGADKITYAAKKIGDYKKAHRAYQIFGLNYFTYLFFHKVPIKKGAFETLEYLKGNGYKIAVASALKKIYLKSYLKRTGIEKYIDSAVGRDEVKASKPDPGVYIQVCKNLGVDPKQCFAVEDSLVGARAAIDAGCKTIIIPDLQQPDEYNRTKAYKVFESLNELLEFLKIEQKNS